LLGGEGEAANSDDDDDDEDLEEIAEVLAAEDVRGQAARSQCASAFQRGPAKVPAVADLKGHDLIQWLQRPPPPLPKLVDQALVHTTRVEHRRLLRLLLEMSDKEKELPLTQAVLLCILRRRQKRKWRWSTTLKTMAATQGALHLLPLYHQGTYPITISTCPIWTSAMRTAGIRAREQLPKQPLAISPEQVQKTLDTCSNIITFTAILLSWHSAARPCDVLKLATADVTINTNATLTIRFRRGKSVRCRGPYSVHTGTLPTRHLTRLQNWISVRRSWLFPKDFTGALIKEQLRRSTGDTRMEQRSIRRGALQCLSKAPGMTDDILMLFSGHTKVATLKRYLDWGKSATHTKNQMCTAASQILVCPSARLL